MGINANVVMISAWPRCLSVDCFFRMSPPSQLRASRQRHHDATVRVPTLRLASISRDRLCYRFLAFSLIARSDTCVNSQAIQPIYLDVLGIRLGLQPLINKSRKGLAVIPSDVDCGL